MVDERAAESPLTEVVHDERTNRILNNLREAADSNTPILIDPEDAAYVQRSFTKAIQRGEQLLHEYAEDLLNVFAKDEKIESKLMVFGRCSQPGHEGLLRSDTEFDYRDGKFLKNNDSYLAKTYSPACSICAEKTNSIASFIQYKNISPNGGGMLHFLRTRIKSTSHIAYKVADIVFNVGAMAKRDKIVNELSHVVSDVYGMKLILVDERDVPAVAQEIPALPKAELIEIKDYTGARRKKSGFEAYKMITRYEGQWVEIQIQSKRMFETERQSYTASHQTYKEAQMEQRRKLGKEYNLLYETLHRMFSQEEVGNREAIEFGHSGKGTDDEF